MAIRISETYRGVFLPVACGLAAGAAAVCFMLLSNMIYHRTIAAMAGLGFWLFAIGSLVVISAAMLLVGLIYFLNRKAAGSGIPELKSAYGNDMGFLPWRSAWVKMLAGVISLGGGASLGREGPTVFISAAVASSMAGVLGVQKNKRRMACVAGSAAGLAAAFNTPLAATTFVLEEIVGDMNSRFLGPALLAAVAGAFVAYAAVGAQPAFMVPKIEAVSWRAYALTPVVAAMAAWIGLFFQQATLRWRALVRKRSKRPFWLQPLFGGLLTWALGIIVFAVSGKLGVFSLGYDDLSAAMRDGAPWMLALLLLAAKLPATVASYACGGCGGIFSPLLFMGGMAGFALAGLAGTHWPITSSEGVLLACVGMSACFGAAVRAPLTALLMIFEMTHQFSIVPALMIGAIISQFMARQTGSLNFYESILQQDGHELSRIHPPRDIKTWQNQPVASIMNRKPIVLRSLEPANVRLALVQYPYKMFPIEILGRYSGMSSRDDLMALVQGEPPRLSNGIVCREEQTVREVAEKMLASSISCAVIVKETSGNVTGFLTLHDLLRAQARVTE